MTKAEKVKAICDDWRKLHPACKDWEDKEVMEAMLLKLSQECPDRVAVSSHAKGVPTFTIKPK